jgi:hypothetical protein
LRRAAFAVTACVALVGAAAARAETTPVALPSPTTPLSTEPPLAATPVAATETRFPGPIDAFQTVLVALAPSGRPRGVAVVQRLIVRGTGDYTFIVPAPVVDVAPAAGTESQPGKRASEVVWQGFSSRRRVLAARMALLRQAAVPFLPLRIEVARRGDRVRVTIVNATAVTVPAPAGAAVRPELMRYMRELRRFVASGEVPGTLVPVAGRTDRRAAVDAPFRVGGTVSLRGARVAGVRGGRARTSGSGRVEVAATVRAGRPFELELEGSPGAVPRLSLVARPAMPGLSGPLPRDPRRAMAFAVAASLAVARARQYSTFVMAPDPNGRRQATYVFRTTLRATSAPPATAATGASDDSAVPVAVLIGLGLLGACALVVLWAHL